MDTSTDMTEPRKTYEIHADLAIARRAMADLNGQMAEADKRIGELELELADAFIRASIRYKKKVEGIHAKGIEPMDVVERKAIVNAIAACGGHLGLAAKALGIGKTTIYRKVQEIEMPIGVRHMMAQAGNPS